MSAAPTAEDPQEAKNRENLRRMAQALVWAVEASDKERHILVVTTPALGPPTCRECSSWKEAAAMLPEIRDANARVHIFWGDKIAVSVAPLGLHTPLGFIAAEDLDQRVLPDGALSFEQPLPELPEPSDDDAGTSAVDPDAAGDLGSSLDD